MRRKENVNKLHTMVGKYYPRHVGLVSSGQRRKLDLSVRMSGSSSIFADWVILWWGIGLSRLTSEEDDVLKQIQAFFSTKEIYKGSSLDSQPPWPTTLRTPFSWTVTWKSDFSPRGWLQAIWILDMSPYLMTYLISGHFFGQEDLIMTFVKP